MIIKTTDLRAKVIERGLQELEVGIKPWAEMPGEDEARRALSALHETRMDVQNALQMPRLPTIVCLCGSTRFKEEFIAANFRETMAGNIVLTVGWFGHADGDVYTPTPQEKSELDALHKRKIDLADEVLILNVGGYIGDSTRSELEYARHHGKKVRFLEDPAKKAWEEIDDDE